MEIKISLELQSFLTRDIELFKALKDNAVEMNTWVQKEYAYLIGKRVKVFGNKGWNIGTITALYPKSVRQKEGGFYINIDVKGPDNMKMLFGLEEVELLED